MNQPINVKVNKDLKESNLGKTERILVHNIVFKLDEMSNDAVAKLFQAESLLLDVGILKEKKFSLDKSEVGWVFENKFLKVN